eukprot:366442-Chlamydomonas_euryale.AAC.26
MLLAQCLARYKPPGGHHGWPISYDVGMICSNAQSSAPVVVTVHPAEGAPLTVHRSPFRATLIHIHICLLLDSGLARTS